MKKSIFYLIVLFVATVNSYSQIAIANWDGFNQNFTGFECTVSSLVENPSKTGINTSNNVLQVETSLSQYEVAYANLGYYLDFTSASSFSLKVFSNVTGQIVLKIANQSNPEINKVVSGYYLSPGTWQEIFFNFNGSVIDNNTYNQISVFPDFDNTTRSDNWYFDDIRTLTIPPFSGDTIANFDNINRIFVDYYTKDVSVITNPKNGGSSLNKTPKCLRVISDTNLYENILTILESNLDFSHKNAISIMVYSDTAGIMLLKLRKPNGENDVIKKYQYTTPGKWEKLTFDFTGTETNSYNSITIYPGYNNTEPDINWYIDEITFDSVQIGPYKSDTICNFDEIIRIFEGWDNIGVSVIRNPYKTGIDTSNYVMRTLSSSAKYEGIKTELERKLNFSKFKSNLFSVKINSSISGAVHLKLFKQEADTVYTLITANYSTPNQWQQLTFDLINVPSNVYNVVALYPDLGGEQTGVAWYIDDLEIIHLTDIIPYSNWDGIEKTFTAIGDAAFTAPLANPFKTGINTSNNLMQIFTTAQNDEGVTTDLEKFIDFSISSAFQLKIFSADTGQVRVKLEGENVSAQALSASYTTANEWQLLTFNFGTSIQSDVYNNISILPEYGQSRTGTWYIDDLAGPGLTENPITLEKTYADWESISPSIETWESVITNITANPVNAGIDTSAHVLQTISNTSAYEGFAITIPGIFNFSNGRTFAIKVKANTAGQILFKIESKVANPESISLRYTKPGSWQQLVYTFSDNLPGVFNKIAIFPDFNNVSSSGSWYFDDIQGPKSIDTLMILTGTISENHEDGGIISDTLIGDAFTSALNKNFWSVTGLPAGVSIDTIKRIGNSRADIVLKGNSGEKHVDDIIVTVTVNKNQFVSNSSNLSGTFNIIANGLYISRDKKVLAHYLPWYNDTSKLAGTLPVRAGWCNGDSCNNPNNINYSNKPFIGEYSQLDEDVLEYHFLTMYLAGIDGIIIDINPSRPEQKMITMKCLNKLKEMHANYPNFSMKFVIAYDQKDQTASIYDDFIYIRDSLTDNPAFSNFRFNDDNEATGYPVIMTWADYNLPYFSKCIDSVYNKQILYLKRDASEFTYSDGTYEWVNYLESNTVTSENKYWGEDYFQDQEVAMANQHKSFIPAPNRNYFFMGAAWPGFDDHNASWGENRWINRNVEDGETMALTFERQINYIPGTAGPVYADMPWIQIVTWNDWPEGTSIEPATNNTYGFNAIKTTQIKIAEFKSIGSADTSAVRIPYAIYQARKNGNTDQAICLINRVMTGNRNYNSVINECCCVSIPVTYKGANTNFDFEIVPNPTFGVARIIIHGRNEGTLKVELFSISGKLVKNAAITDYDENSIYLLDIDGLENGVYFLRLNTVSALITKELIINAH